MFAKWLCWVLVVGLATGTGIAAAQDGKGSSDAKPRINVVPSPNQSGLAKQREASSAVQRKLRETRVDFKADDEPLETVLKRLAAELTLEIKLDRVGFEDAGISPETPITIDVRQVSGDTLLEVILGPIELNYAIDVSQILVTTPEEIESIGMVTRFYPLRDLLGPEGKDVELDYDTLIEILTTVVAPESWEELGGPGTISPFASGLAITQSQQIHQVIEQLFSALRQARNLPDDNYEVQPIMATVDRLQYQRTWEELRSTRISVSAEEMPLEALIEHLAVDTGINFVVDRESIADMAQIDSLLIDGEWVNMQVDQVLKQILRQCQLTWYITDNVVVITSPEQAENTDLRIKVYPLRDLVPSGPLFGLQRNPWNQQVPPLTGMGGMGCGFSPKYHSIHAGTWDPNAFPFPDYDEIIELVTTTIVREAWEELGGAGTLIEFAWADCLVVAQSWDLHDRVEDLFTQIRANHEPNELQSEEPDEDYLLIHSYYVQAHRQTGELLIDRDDLRELTERMKTLIDEQSWEDEGVFVQVLDDRVIIRHRKSVHDQVAPFFAATHVVTRIQDDLFSGGLNISGLHFVPQPPRVPAAETKSP